MALSRDGDMHNSIRTATTGDVVVVYNIINFNHGQNFESLRPLARSSSLMRCWIDESPHQFCVGGERRVWDAPPPTSCWGKSSSSSSVFQFKGLDAQGTCMKQERRLSETFAGLCTTFDVNNSTDSPFRDCLALPGWHVKRSQTTPIYFIRVGDSTVWTGRWLRPTQNVRVCITQETV